MLCRIGVVVFCIETCAIVSCVVCCVVAVVVVVILLMCSHVAVEAGC